MAPRRVPWLRLFAEGCVIVASVLLALAADAWWDGHRERVEETQILAGLSEELAANRVTLAGDIEIVSAARDQLRTLASPLSNFSIDSSEIPMETILSPIHRTFSVRLADGFRTSTVNSGKLALIRDPLLRAALIEIESFEATLAQLEDWIGTLSQEGAVALAGYPEALNAYRSDMPVDQRTLPLAFVDVVRQDREVMAIVGAKINYWNGYIGQLGRLDAHLERVIHLIASAAHD